MSLSFTQQEQEWIKKAYGYDESEQAFSGINSIYDNTIKTAQSQTDEQKRLLQFAYGDTVNQAKGQYDNMANLYQKAYGDQAVQLNTQYQQNTNAYGNNQNQLAQMGLTGSGYNAYLMQQAYGDYQGGKSNAYNTAQQGQMTMQQVYGDVTNQAQRDLTQGVGKANYTMQQIYGEAEQGRAMEKQNVYNQIKQEYQTKQDEYNENFAALQYDYKQGGADLEYAKFLNSSDSITDEQYKAFETTYKTEIADNLNKEFETALNSGGDMASVFARIESEHTNKLIDDSQRADFYYRDLKEGVSLVSTLEQYNIMKADIEKEKEKLGSKYQTVLTELNKSAFSPEKIKAKKEEEKLSNPGNPGAFIGEKIADSVENYIPQKDREYSFLKPGKGAKSRTAYVVKDKSNQKPVPQTSLSLGENVSISITNPDGKQEQKEAKLTGYVTNDPFKKEDLWLELKNKDMKAGQIVKASDGKYYLRGNNAFFRLNVDMGW